MKTTFKIFGAIMGLGLVLLIGLHLFLQFGLTKTLREVVLPQLEADTGIKAKVGHLSLNVPGGILYLKDVSIQNPEGFLLENMASIERIRVEVDILSLLKQKLIRVKNVEMKNALVNVIRNKDGELNIYSLSAEPPPSGDGQPGSEESDVSPTPLPEVLIEALQCSAQVHYLDFKLDQLDFTLDLSVTGSKISTQLDPDTPWGDVSVFGSLGSKRTRFVTDLQMRLAPVIDPQSPTFDLSGKMLEIDPRIMEKAYDKLGLRSAPFGLDMFLECRDGWFEDSLIMLNITDIVFEDKLADRMGGMASIASLRFPVVIEGPVQKPAVDVERALKDALGDNAETLVDALLRGAAAKEAGLDEPPETLTDAAVAVLGKHVEEIGESETVQEVLKDLADGESSDTNAPSVINSDILIDILGEQVDEIGEDEALKDGLKDLGKLLLGR